MNTKQGLAVTSLAQPRRTATVNGVLRTAALRLDVGLAPEPTFLMTAPRKMGLAAESAVMYLGTDQVAGATLFVSLNASTSVGQVASLCNELVGRVGAGGTPRFQGSVRPLSFRMPDGSHVDWDVNNEELPLCLWERLGEPAASLGVRVLSVALDGEADLAALRRGAAGLVDCIEHKGYADSSRSNTDL